MRRETFKRGIAMIELIFALVIIGITLMSAPMLINQSINSGYVALQQESIAAAAAHTNILLSKPWDEADTNRTLGQSPIITIPDNIGNNFSFRGILGGGVGMPGVGMPNLGIGGTSSRKPFSWNGNIVAPTNMGIDFNESIQNVFSLNDIDDFSGTSFGLSLYNAESTNAETGDYIDQQIKISTNVHFASDGRSNPNLFTTTTPNIGNSIFNSNIATPTQIKGVQVTLTTENTDILELNKTITFHAFSCNLGTYIIGGEGR